jgi:acyl-CoA hydrolase
MYNQHPEFNDGITASLTQDTSGHFIMVKADTQGRPVGKPEIMTNQTAMDYLHQGQSHLLSLLDPEYGQRQQQIDQSGQQIKQTGEYQQGSLANDRTRLGLEGQRVAIARQAAAAAERAGKMGSVISTDQGMFVPILGKDGKFVLEPLTADGKALNKSAVPIDPATGFKIAQQVEADIASDKSLRGASKDRIDTARQRLTANYRAMVSGSTPQGSGFNPRAGLDAVKPAAAAAPTVAADSESQYTDKPAPTNIFQDITTGLRGY